MTSKIKIQKEAQGYTRVLAHCGICKYYTSDAITTRGSYVTWTIEKNKRCGLGGFAVLKTAVCNLFVQKEGR